MVHTLIYSVAVVQIVIFTRSGRVLLLPVMRMFWGCMVTVSVEEMVIQCSVTSIVVRTLLILLATHHQLSSSSRPMYVIVGSRISPDAIFLTDTRFHGLDFACRP